MAHSKQEDSYNCGVYCLIVCFDVQTKKPCIYIMLYPNLSVVFFYVTFHFNFFFLFHLFKMKPLLLSITDLTFFFTCMPYIIFQFAERFFSNEPITNIPQSELFSAREKIASALIMFNGENKMPT